MRRLILICLQISFLLGMTPAFAGVYNVVWTTPDEYSDVVKDIPDYLQTTTWVYFQYKDVSYTTIHVFKDDYHDPYIKVIAYGHSTPEDRDVVTRSVGYMWSAHPSEEGSDILYLDDYFIRNVMQDQRELMRTAYLMFDNALICIHLQLDLPEWLTDAAPFKIDKDWHPKSMPF